MNPVDQMLKNFRDGRELMAEQLAYLERPDTHFTAAGNRDIKPEWIAKLRQRIAEMDRIIAACAAPPDNR